MKPQLHDTWRPILRLPNWSICTLLLTSTISITWAQVMFRVKWSEFKPFTMRIFYFLRNVGTSWGVSWKALEVCYVKWKKESEENLRLWLPCPIIKEFGGACFCLFVCLFFMKGIPMTHSMLVSSTEDSLFYYLFHVNVIHWRMLALLNLNHLAHSNWLKTRSV